MRTPSQRGTPPTEEDRARTIANLAKLPAADKPTFPHAVRQAMEEIKNPEPVLRQLAADTSLERRLRFAALYALLLRLRREERYLDYGKLVRRFEGEFGREPYFYTFRATLTRAKGDLASLRSAMEYARRAVELMPEVAAVVHQFAMFCIEYLERSKTIPSTRELDEAEWYVDRAIGLSHGSIGRHLESKSRVLAMRGEFEAARSAITQAIEVEPRGSRDYLRRLTQYQTTRARIDLMEERVHWEREHQLFRTELAEFKGQQLQLLGLLAAIVALIVTAGNIASQTGGIEGARLIVVAAGAISIVFGTFSLLNNSSVSRVLVAMAVGCAMIIAGLLYPVSWLW